MQPSKTLTVATNPYAAIDHEGRPCGVCSIDPFDPRFYAPTKGMSDVRGYVGARLAADPPVIRELDAKEGEHTQRTARLDRTWEFIFAPFTLPDTTYYRRQVREGVLIAADDATARECGVKALPVALVRQNAKGRARCRVEAVWSDPPVVLAAPAPAPQLELPKPRKTSAAKAADTDETPSV